jgi:hypothetical protein
MLSLSALFSRASPARTSVKITLNDPDPEAPRGDGKGRRIKMRMVVANKNDKGEWDVAVGWITDRTGSSSNVGSGMTLERAIEASAALHDTMPASKSIFLALGGALAEEITDWNAGLARSGTLAEPARDLAPGASRAVDPTRPETILYDLGEIPETTGDRSFSAIFLLQSLLVQGMLGVGQEMYEIPVRLSATADGGIAIAEIGTMNIGEPNVGEPNVGDGRTP